jgi:hypothetical protein
MPSARLHLVLSGILLLTVGATGCMQNPSYFPFLLPAGPIQRTHAKPPGIGNFANFDKNAVRIEVRPLRSTNPVGTQHLVIATVLDDEGTPRRKRRVEWMLEGVGSIVEVDESGYLAGRGYKVDNRYAVSYTDMFEHTITRGNEDPTDDFLISPGQSWCIVSSPEEGISRLTVFAPEIYDWEKRKVEVEVHWANAQWQFPQPATVRAGSQHPLTTHIFRHSDRVPLPNYRVRYTVLDGPPAVLLPNQTREAIATTDQTGNATLNVGQLQLQPGVNKIGVEIIRPADPTNPGTPPVALARYETSIDWQAPQLALNLEGPKDIVVNEEVPATLVVSNTGKVDAQRGQVRMAIPQGMSFVRSDPPPDREQGGYLYWTLASLGGGRQQNIQATFKAQNKGTFTTTAQAVTTDGLRADTSTSFRADTAQIKVRIDGLTSASVNERVPMRITVENPSGGTAHNVRLEVNSADGMEFETRDNLFDRTVNQTIPSIGPGDSRTFPLTALARKPGKLAAKATAKTNGGLTSEGEWAAAFQNAMIAIRRTGPATVALGRDAEWSIRVRNEGDVALSSVMIRERLPAELSFRGASNGGQFDSRANEVLWNLGAMPRGEEVTLRYSAVGARMTTRGVVTTIATAASNLEKSEQSTVEVLGVPALRVEAMSDFNPIEVGRRLNYTIRVTNTGTLALDSVGVIADVPKELRSLDALGPRRGTINGQVVTFPVIESIAPGQTVTLSIPAQALKEGDTRFRVAVKALSMSEPVIQEEATRIVPVMRGPNFP